MMIPLSKPNRTNFKTNNWKSIITYEKINKKFEKKEKITVSKDNEIEAKRKYTNESIINGYFDYFTQIINPEFIKSTNIQHMANIE